MPLSLTEGEPIPSLGPHQVVPVQNYANEPAFRQACWHALQKFKDAGCRELQSLVIPPDHSLADATKYFKTDEVLAQIHPLAQPKPKLVFWFCKRTRGGLVREHVKDDERYVWYSFDIAKATHPGGRA